jgi:hypothetical protein
MLTVVLTTLALTLLVVGVHYEALRVASRCAAAARVPARLRVGLAVLLALLAHFVEAVLFAFGWALMGSTGQAALSGETAEPGTLLYFSLVTYTSLGYGDVVPLGPARILAGVESLVGLVLIAWTASFTYFEMRRYWSDDVEPPAIRGDER